MNVIKFFRGPKASYLPNSTHQDGVYFATDTKELLMNGNAYGDTIASVSFSEVASGANKGKVLATITTTGGQTFADLDTQCYGRTEINAMIAELEAATESATIDNADGSINVTVDGNGDGTDINVNIKSGEKVLKKDGSAGIYTNFKLEKLASATNANTAASYELVAYDSAETAGSRQVLGARIDIAKDLFLKSATVVDASGNAIGTQGAGTAKYLRLVFNIADGTESTTDIDISSFVQEAEAGAGLSVTSGVVSIVENSGSEVLTFSDGNGSFTTAHALVIGTDDIKIQHIQDAIDYSIENALSWIEVPANSNSGE